QIDLVLALREALVSRSTEGMNPDHRRLVEYLRRALDSHGSISREEIMRYRVMENNTERRQRQTASGNSPYSISAVLFSRLSLAEIGVRADIIRSLSASPLHSLEPLTERDVMLGDCVYSHDEINRVLGVDSRMAPVGTDPDDFHQLMRKRAITAAALTGRSYGRNRGNQGPRYQPPRLPDMDLYRMFRDPSVVRAAIEGDLAPIHRAIQGIQLTMPDVMRLDKRSENTLGTHLRHFRDYLDEQARRAGYATR
ncbi:hypothetical protein PMAYCL1PPCAC_19992, partial [Pristionchus mayeri]